MSSPTVDLSVVPPSRWRNICLRLSQGIYLVVLISVSVGGFYSPLLAGRAYFEARLPSCWATVCLKGK